MSQILDQLLLEDIAAGCPQQLLQFQRCMQLASGDISQCWDQQRVLAGCLKTNVPLMQRIRAECAAYLRQYEDCLRANMDKVVVCEPVLQDLRACAVNHVEGRVNKMQ